MHNLPTIDSLRAVLHQPLDRELKTLLGDRLIDTIHCGLQDHTHVVVVEQGDSDEALVQALGFSPLSSRTECDWIERHEGWWELLYTVGEDGFAYIVLVEDSERLPLTKWCRAS